MTGDVGVDPPVCQDCNQLLAEKQGASRQAARCIRRRADRQQLAEDDERNMRAARRQVELFMGTASESV